MIINWEREAWWYFVKISRNYSGRKNHLTTAKPSFSGIIDRGGRRVMERGISRRGGQLIRRRRRGRGVRNGGWPVDFSPIEYLCPIGDQVCTADWLEPTNGIKLKGSESGRFRMKRDAWNHAIRRILLACIESYGRIDWEKSIGFFLFFSWFSWTVNFFEE